MYLAATFLMLGCTEMGDVIEHDGLFMLKIKNGPFKTNCYYVRDNKNICYLIDPGMGINIITEALDYFGCKKIDFILCTHGHFDHVFGCSFFSQKFGVKPYIHQNDRSLLTSMKFQMMVCGVSAAYEKSDYLYFDDNIPNNVKLLHTPGHTPGSCVIAINNAYFTGDTLYLEDIPISKLPGYDERKLKNSIDLIERNLKLNTLVLPGHGAHGFYHTMTC